MKEKLGFSSKCSHLLYPLNDCEKLCDVVGYPNGILEFNRFEIETLMRNIISTSLAF